MPCLGLFVCASFAPGQELVIPPPLQPSAPALGAGFDEKKNAQVQDRRKIFELLSGRWHLNAKMSRVGSDRTLDYDGVMVGRFIGGSSFFQVETETFLPTGQKANSTSIQIYDSGSETYRMIENLGDKIMVEMVGRVSGDEIIWKPLHGISYEVAEYVIRFVSPDVLESRTELQETLDSPKIVVVTQFRRVKDELAPPVALPGFNAGPATPLPEEASKPVAPAK